MNATTRSFAVLAVALCATGCKKETAIERVANEVAAAPGADPVKLDVTVAKTDVTLGDDIVFRVKLTNAGASKVTVNVPRLDRRSVSFRVRRADGWISTVTRLHAELSDRGEFVWEAGDVKELAPGESFAKDVSTVAVEAGKLAFTASYARQGAPAPLAGPTIDVTVTPADPKAPRLGVAMETSHGSYRAVFRPDVAYNTVEAFATLAKKGFYTGLKFHRILKGFMAQGGDPLGTGEGGPGYFLPIEAGPKLRHTRGVMSMARTPIPDTAGSQFFLMFAANSSLDPVPGRRGGEGYTTFAEMVDGEEMLKNLEAIPCSPNSQGEPSVPKEVVQIRTATLVTLP